MITEKPSWIRHEGLQIFSIDIQPGDLRFATGGGDQKVSSETFILCLAQFALSSCLSQLASVLLTVVLLIHAASLLSLNGVSFLRSSIIRNLR